MKLDEITSEQEQQKLDEILPVLGAVAGGAARLAATGIGAAARGAMAVGRGVGSALGRAGTTIAKTAPAQAVGQVSGLSGGGEDPAAQAQQIAAAKKEVQDQIKAKQQELQQLQQQLAQIK